MFFFIDDLWLTIQLSDQYTQHCKTSESKPIPLKQIHLVSILTQPNTIGQIAKQLQRHNTDQT